ncbi:DUF2264 domain-containing protein [Biostraticola tofi]|uniref:DUF2264 domain-containing protein n=1 Tax=Biostraticola tofi TaxID=466109 RepID=A0A4R3YRN6_9GAMM|nr:DUF2264 domain-containing protein [Biostraticola tofi]TCV95100.1 hypothetical protein EDC52_10631 [Biostraticola tofi]
MESKNAYCNIMRKWAESAKPFFTQHYSRIKMGNTAAHYPDDVAQMEGFSRMLWGLLPLWSAGHSTDLLADYTAGVRHGSDPQHQEYWGEVSGPDQRCVEMAAYALAMALPDSLLWASLSVDEQDNLTHWLQQSADLPVPNNNWHFFPVLVQVGFKCAGRVYDMSVINSHLDAIEPFWLGNGWYSDGMGRPRDYYNSCAFHYYGLLYSHFMQDVDPERCERYRQRAIAFALEHIYWFSADGPAIPFGRSLTYRFVQAAFWSAAAFTGLDVFSPGIIKGIILRHIDWWLEQPFITHDGLFSIGYGYPNLTMAEDYNSPGSPYWALKSLLILAIDDQSEFWQSEPEPFPALEKVHFIPQATQAIVHSEDSRHAWMLMSGQFHPLNFVNTDAKYCKFAYSSHFGFTIERGAYGLNHASCDAMLLFSEHDNYYRGRRESRSTTMTDQFIRSEWYPWDDVKVITWLIPCEHGHVRIHCVETAREIDCVEGGFAVNYHRLQQTLDDTSALFIRSENGGSGVIDLLNNRHTTTVITPPNSNIVYAEPSIVPCLAKDLSAGTHWLAGWYSSSLSGKQEPAPEVRFDTVNRRLMLDSTPINIY